MAKESFYFSYMILVLTLVASHSHASTQPRCHEDERSALLVFKATFFTRQPECCYGATSDEKAKIESWNASTRKTQSDCCSWAGVECDKVSGHVIGLDLSCSCLTGKINSNTSLFRLLRLRSLNLASNDFNCQIPSAIGNLGSLSHLNFSQSNFMGHIPHWLGNLTQLVHLDLGYNSLNGTIPSSLGRLGHLNYLDLGSNSLTGEVPSFLGNLVQLKFLRLRDNMFIGKIPSSQMNYSKIQEYLTLIDLSSNNFSGAIPKTIGSLKNLKLLNLSNNILTGPLPPFLANLTDLEALDLSQNRLSGEIPQELTQLTSLAVFNVSYNRLTGPIPQWRQFATFENNSYKGNSGLCGTPLSRKCGDPKVSPPS